MLGGETCGVLGQGCHLRGRMELEPWWGVVKTSLTGPWQVNGRSDLSWDDSVRIDVRYVENWSLTFDLMILWKTVGAVVRGSGAY